jgi:serine-type D-Ala-D-Ala carboxypeptidase (penicillin-binding protein 5/6)
LKQLKLIISTILLILFISSNSFAGELVASKPRVKPKSKPKTIYVSAPITYDAYVIADAETGIVLEGENINKPRPLASVTKIMLACVVIDKINNGEIQLNDIITAPKKVEAIGGTSVFLKKGESFTLEELMQAILIQSANDASHAVAEYVAGSVPSFIVLMNNKAKELGMNDTVYNSVHGLPPAKGEQDNISTCIDMIKLAQEALKSEKLLEWTSTEYTIFRKSVIHNHNKLLGAMPDYVDGIKTGFTRRAGFNLVATGKNDERRIIVVILGSSAPKLRDSFAEIKFREYLIKGEGG